MTSEFQETFPRDQFLKVFDDELHLTPVNYALQYIFQNIFASSHHKVNGMNLPVKPLEFKVI